MKLEYIYTIKKENTSWVIKILLLLLSIPIILALFSNNLDSIIDALDVIIFFVVFFSPIAIFIYIYNKYRIYKIKKVINSGNKLQGYIIDTFQERRAMARHQVHENIRFDYCLKVKVNNEICIIHDLDNNDAYKFLDRKIKLNNIDNLLPILIYEKDGLIYADLDSVNLELLNNQ